MLTIGKLGAGQEAYYLDKVAQGTEDYYSGEGEAKGRWTGDAAADLGLEGNVGADQLTAMLTGRNPADGSTLLGMGGVPSGRGAVPGFDLTFSAPKSVSLLWALGDEPTQAAVREAHERSVDAALAYMQREACWTRRGAGGATFVNGNGYIAAAFRHRSSRAGDPQLHTHTLIANATEGPDGRWTRLYHPAIYDHAKTAGYLYEAQLRHELTRTLGVRWQPVRRGIAELAGFNDEQLRRFSTRRAEILAAVGGPDASARARQVATLDTRRAKEPDLSTKTMRERWQERAAEVGLDAQALERVLGRNLQPAAGTRAVLTAEQVDRAVTARASHFDRRDVIQAVAQSLPNGGDAREVERIADAYLATENVIRIGEGPKGDRFTTRRIWELEQQALATVERLRSAERAIAGEPIAGRVIAARPTLKPDQAEMVRRLLSGGEGVSIVIGEAGTGKTYAIVAAAEGWAQAGIPLRAAAPTWRAANVLSAEGLPATSIAALLGELDDSQSRGHLALPRSSVLLVDEAAMVDSQTLARLIAQTDQAGAKLVLVGDPEQLPELEAGGLFRAIAERTEPIYLHEVIRHHHELDRTAAKRIREGRGVEAFELYRSGERVVVAPDADSKREAIVSDWWRSFSVGDDALMIAKRNADVERLNAMARSVMREEGRLGSVEIEVGGQAFATGDQVVTRVNAPGDGVYNRMRWSINEVDAQRRAVTLDCLDQERRVVLGPEYLDQTNAASAAASLQHGYAATLYIAQGSTVDRAFVAADASMDRHDYYVAMSRSREEVLLYAAPEVGLSREEYAPRQPSQRQPLDHIRSAIEREGAQISATDEAVRAPLQKLPTSDLVKRRAELEQELRAAGLAERHVAPASSPPAPSNAGKAELTMVESILVEHRRRVITADRISPPAYITDALGERPQEPRDRAAWERGVEQIERHRQVHGIADRRSALGAVPSNGQKRAEWARQRVELHAVQRQLGVSHELSLDRSAGIELGL
ncbi:MAG: relaxase domain-containing protein [Chloroflexota bacterium]|nr:relaxase domain-containing protein [Chloroflexota bacterium]